MVSRTRSTILILISSFLFSVSSQNSCASQVLQKLNSVPLTNYPPVELFAEAVKEVAPMYFANVQLDAFPDAVVCDIIYHIERNSIRLEHGELVEYVYDRERALQNLVKFCDYDPRPHITANGKRLFYEIKKSLIEYVRTNRREELQNPGVDFEYLDSDDSDSSFD